MVGPPRGYVSTVLLVGCLAARGWNCNPVTAMTAALLAGAVIRGTDLLWLRTVIGFDKPVLRYGPYPFILGDIVLVALVFSMASILLAPEGTR